MTHLGISHPSPRVRSRRSNFQKKEPKVRQQCSGVTTDEHRREEEPQEVRRACTGGLLYAAQPPVGRLYAAQSPIGLLPLRRAAAGQPPGSTSAAVGLSHPAPPTPSICISPALPPPLPLPAMHAACFLSPAGRPRAPEGRGWKVGGGAGGLRFSALSRPNGSSQQDFRELLRGIRFGRPFGTDSAPAGHGAGAEAVPKAPSVVMHST
jgi:hypothetical protein